MLARIVVVDGEQRCTRSGQVPFGRPVGRVHSRVHIGRTQMANKTIPSSLSPSAIRAIVPRVRICDQATLPDVSAQKTY